MNRILMIFLFSCLNPLAAMEVKAPAQAPRNAWKPNGAWKTPLCATDHVHGVPAHLLDDDDFPCLNTATLVVSPAKRVRAKKLRPITVTNNICEFYNAIANLIRKRVPSKIIVQSIRKHHTNLITRRIGDKDGMYQSFRGMTMLQYAIWNIENDEKVRHALPRILIEAGSDLDACVEDPKHPDGYHSLNILHMFASTDEKLRPLDYDLIAMCCTPTNINTVSVSQHKVANQFSDRPLSGSPLEVAANYGKGKLIRLFVTHGADDKLLSEQQAAKYRDVIEQGKACVQARHDRMDELRKLFANLQLPTTVRHVNNMVVEYDGRYVAGEGIGE